MLLLENINYAMDSNVNSVDVGTLVLKAKEKIYCSLKVEIYRGMNVKMELFIFYLLNNA